jgi:HSP20 family protein
MEVPGIKQEDLDIHIDGNTLSVDGERKVEQDEKRENFRRVERQYGSFSRSFELPSSADCDKISANFQDGILQIEVPKRAEARGKQIQIGGGTAKGQPSTAKEKPRAA